MDISVAWTCSIAARSRARASSACSSARSVSCRSAASSARASSASCRAVCRRTLVNGPQRPHPPGPGRRWRRPEAGQPTAAAAGTSAAAGPTAQCDGANGLIPQKAAQVVGQLRPRCIAVRAAWPSP